MSILAQIGTKVGSEIKNLDVRLSSAETAIVNLGGQTPPPTGNFTIEPVTWTNLTEINLSGEKLLNTDFSLATLGLGVEVVILISWTNSTKTALVGEIYEIDLVQSNGGMRLTNSTQSIFASASQIQNNVQAVTPKNWSVTSSTPLDNDKLAQGIIKGDGGAVSIQQMFSNPIANGTKLVVKVTRTDTNINGVVHVKTLRANETPYGVDRNITFADGYVEFEATELTYGLRFSTAHGTREISSISLFQGEVSGGSVQAFTGGSLEKISGVDGYNAGASSVQKIDGQSNGYVQFQIGTPSKSVRVGLVELDSDFEVDPPFQMNFGGGTIDLYTPWLANYETYESGDWFRIRHYSASNEIRFQKRQVVYGHDASFVIETATGSNYTYPSAQRPLVIALNGSGNLTIGQYYKIYSVRATDQAVNLYDLDGNSKGWHGGSTRGSRYEVVEELGEDYVTFYTHPTFSNGNDLYLDTTFHTTGSRLNDVQIAT